MSTLTSPGENTVARDPYSATRSTAAWLLLVGLATPTAPVWGEAWPRGEGRLFSSSKLEYLQSDAYWDTDGKRHDLAEPFRKLSLEQYVEYGLTDKDTITAKLIASTLDDGASANSGLEDLELGYRRFFMEQHGWMVSSGLTAIVPTGYSRTEMPQLGYGRFGLEPMLAVGYGWTVSGQNGYLETVGRYRWYSGYPSDQLRLSLTVGQDLNRSLQLMVQPELQWGVDNGSPNRIDATTSIASYYRFCKITLHGRVKLSEEISFLLSGYQVVWGENTGVGRGLAASLWLEF